LIIRISSDEGRRGDKLPFFLLYLIFLVLRSKRKQISAGLSHSLPGYFPDTSRFYFLFVLSVEFGQSGTDAKMVNIAGLVVPGVSVV